jgi:uncharacterized repeat protein (TIGR01451 family)
MSPATTIRMSAWSSNRLRIVVIVALLFANLSPVLGISSGAASAHPADVRAAVSDQSPAQAAAATAPAIVATKTDRLLIDRDGDGKADPGDTLRYTVVVSNTGAADATGVMFDDTLDRNVTLAPGSIETTPLALNQAATTPEDTPIPLTLGGSDADGDLLAYTSSPRRRTAA